MNSISWMTVAPGKGGVVEREIDPDRGTIILRPPPESEGPMLRVIEGYRRHQFNKVPGYCSWALQELMAKFGVKGARPSGMGNAKEMPHSLRSIGFRQVAVSQAQPGDVAVYTRAAGGYGHIGVVTGGPPLLRASMVGGGIGAKRQAAVSAVRDRGPALGTQEAVAGTRGGLPPTERAPGFFDALIESLHHPFVRPPQTRGEEFLASTLGRLGERGVETGDAMDMLPAVRSVLSSVGGLAAAPRLPLGNPLAEFVKAELAGTPELQDIVDYVFGG